MHNRHKLIQIETQYIKIIKIAVKNASLCRKNCDMRTLLKYAKMRQRAKYVAYSHKTDMHSWILEMFPVNQFRGRHGP